MIYPALDKQGRMPHSPVLRLLLSLPLSLSPFLSFSSLSSLFLLFTCPPSTSTSPLIASLLSPPSHPLPLLPLFSLSLCPPSLLSSLLTSSVLSTPSLSISPLFSSPSFSHLSSPLAPTSPLAPSLLSTPLSLLSSSLSPSPPLCIAACPSSPH